jgi:hypothetical protein
MSNRFHGPLQALSKTLPRIINPLIELQFSAQPVGRRRNGRSRISPLPVPLGTGA